MSKSHIRCIHCGGMIEYNYAESNLIECKCGFIQSEQYVLGYWAGRNAALIVGSREMQSVGCPAEDKPSGTPTAAHEPPTAAATPLPTLNTGSRAIALWKQAMESYSSNQLLSWVGTHLKDINEAIAQRQADARDVTRCPTCGSSKTDIVFVSMRQCDACKIYFEA